MLISGLSFGQLFGQDEPEETQGYFTDDGYPEPTFGTDPGYYDGDPPDQGTDAGPGTGGGPGNPGPRLPIDSWFWLLPAAGLALGYRLLKPSKEEASL